MTTRIHRYGNYLNIIFIINDPAYLTEPYIREYSWVSMPDQVIPPYPCETSPEGTIVPAGKVPSYLPGQNDFLSDFAVEYGIPLEAALGGAEETSPDYIKKTQDDEGGAAHDDGALQARAVNAMGYEERIRTSEGESMKRTRHVSAAIFVLALVFGSGASARAQSEITLLAVGPMRAPTQKIVDNFQAKTGNKVKVTYGNGVETRQMVAKGQPARRLAAHRAFPGSDGVWKHRSRAARRWLPAFLQGWRCPRAGPNRISPRPRP